MSSAALHVRRDTSLSQKTMKLTVCVALLLVVGVVLGGYWYNAPCPGWLRRRGSGGRKNCVRRGVWKRGPKLRLDRFINTGKRNKPASSTTT